MAAQVKLVEMETKPGNSRLMTPVEASEFLCVPEKTLANWRSERRGPSFVRFENRLIRYRKTDLEKYISGNIVQPLES